MAKGSILVVEDNPINLKLIKVLLTVEGYEVFISTNAEEALDMLSKIHPQLILMDIQLPSMNGLELTKKLKADSKYQKIPIIAITAYAMKNDEQKVLEAGCDGYIAKPIDVTKFSQTIEDYLKDVVDQS